MFMYMFPYVLTIMCSITLQRRDGSVVNRLFLWIGVTSAWSQSLVSLLVLYNCWKMCVMMGAICSAVSLRTLAGSSSGPVALFWLRFFNCLIMPFVPISRWGMLEYNEGSITGMGYLSLVNTEVNWLLRAFALSRSFVIGLSFTLRVGMPMFFSFVCLDEWPESFWICF